MDSLDDEHDLNPILEALRYSNPTALPTTEEYPASEAPIMHVFLIDAPQRDRRSLRAVLLRHRQTSQGQQQSPGAPGADPACPSCCWRS